MNMSDKIDKRSILIGAGVGIAIAAGLAVSLNNIILGIGVGLAIGCGVGVALHRKKDK